MRFSLAPPLKHSSNMRKQAICRFYRLLIDGLGQILPLQGMQNSQPLAPPMQAKE